MTTRELVQLKDNLITSLSKIVVSLSEVDKPKLWSLGDVIITPLVDLLSSCCSTSPTGSIVPPASTTDL